MKSKLKIPKLSSKLDAPGRRSLAAALAVTALIFITAAILPLAFKAPVGAVETETSYGERSALFARYWSGETEGISVEQISQPGKKDAEYCAGRLDELFAQSLIDRGNAVTESEGREYITVSAGGAQEMRVCRAWRQSVGDWRSWTDVCFDMDSGDIYYLYLSDECIFNAESYANVINDKIDTRTVAGIIADSLGYHLQYLDWSGNAGDAATAIYVSDGSAACMEISCVYYKSTLLDIKVTSIQGA